VQLHQRSGARQPPATRSAAGLPAEAQGNQNRQPAKAAGDYPEEANVEQYHVFTTQKEDAKDELWFGVEVNTVMPAEPQYMHWSEASIT
jgi:hypothetical protein